VSTFFQHHADTSCHARILRILLTSSVYDGGNAGLYLSGSRYPGLLIRIDSSEFRGLQRPLFLALNSGIDDEATVVSWYVTCSILAVLSSTVTHLCFSSRIFLAVRSCLMSVILGRIAERLIFLRTKTSASSAI
jgi:hypothetical protein